jgi:hypothetical protein
MSAPIVPPPITATCSIVVSSVRAVSSGHHNAPSMTPGLEIPRLRTAAAGKSLCPKPASAV